MNPEIIVSCISNSWGGLEIMALDHVKYLKKHGITSVLICSEHSPLHKKAQETGIKEIIKISKNRKYLSINYLRKKLKNIKIVHSHHSHDLWLLVPALNLGRSKAHLFLSKHVASGVSKKDIFHRYLYRRVNKIFAVSNFIKDNVIETCPVKESKVILMNNGIDLNNFNRAKYHRNEIRDELKIGRDKILIGLIGRITPGKGHYEFIEAAEIINRKYINDVTFLIVGCASEGEENIESDIIQMTKKKNVTNIIFTGYRNDIQKVLAGLDILAFPSHDESFGITLLEAMAMEVPVVASNNSGIPDIIPSDKYGVLIPPKDSEALANGILKLLNNTELRNTISVNARKRVEENFDIEKITNELIEIYMLRK